MNDEICFLRPFTDMDGLAHPVLEPTAETRCAMAVIPRCLKKLARMALRWPAGC